MSAAKKINTHTHIVDIFGSTKGRDQPIMKMEKAVELVKCLDREILESDDYVFFDPFCKAGEILLATALVSNQYRNQSKKIIKLEDIKKDIYDSNRYFALTPDERHYRLSLRTFFGNKNSHKPEIKKNMRNGNYLSEEDGKLDKEKFNKELDAMLEYIKEKSGGRKIIAVGNPPYQEADGGGTGSSAKPIYNIFIKELIDSNNINGYCLVIPSRWFSGGKGLDKFREQMLTLGGIKKIKYFENSSHVFPSVDIRGGVCFINWQSNFSGETQFINGDKKQMLKVNKYDIFLPHLKAHTIVDKILSTHDVFLDTMVWPRNPFGISSNYFQNRSSRDGNPSNTIECFSVGKKTYLISRENIRKNIVELDKFQVAFPKASGGGKGHRDKILLKPEHFFILGRNQVSTETYSVAGSFLTLNEAENYLLFCQTSFVRFLLGLRKPTQNTSQKNFSWIPLMDIQKQWTDPLLFEHFKILKKEQNYIKETVDRWTA